MTTISELNRELAEEGNFEIVVDWSSLFDLVPAIEMDKKRYLAKLQYLIGQMSEQEATPQTLSCFADFLSQRWERIRQSDMSYTADPKVGMNQIAWHLAVDIAPIINRSAYSLFSKELGECFNSAVKIIDILTVLKGPLRFEIVERLELVTLNEYFRANESMAAALTKWDGYKNHEIYKALLIVFVRIFIHQCNGAPADNVASKAAACKLREVIEGLAHIDTLGAHMAQLIQGDLGLMYRSFLDIPVVGPEVNRVAPAFRLFTPAPSPTPILNVGQNLFPPLPPLNRGGLM